MEVFWVILAILTLLLARKALGHYLAYRKVAKEYGGAVYRPCGVAGCGVPHWEPPRGKS